jgi:hypothetical protein
MSTGVVETIGALPSVLPDSLNVFVVRFTIYSNLAVSRSADIYVIAMDSALRKFFTTCIITAGSYSRHSKTVTVMPYKTS